MNLNPFIQILAVVLISTTSLFATPLDELLGRMPTNSNEEKQAVLDGLQKLGEAGVRELCGRLKDEPLDGKVCAALYNLGHLASLAGQEDTRAMMARVYGDVLTSEASNDTKRFLITELRTLGRTESVAPVGSLLNEPELCEPAAQALVSIGGKEALQALQRALPDLQGRSRMTVVTALGRLQDASTVKVLLKEMESPDFNLRMAAAFALAESGDPAAMPVLRNAAGSDEAAEKRHALHELLRYADRLATRGHTGEAMDLCRWLKETFPDQVHIQSASLHLLVRLEGSKAFGEILEAMASEEPRIRDTASALLASLPKGAINMTEASIDRMLENASPVKHAQLLKLLGQSADKVGLPAIKRGLSNPNEAVREAAMQAMARVGGPHEVSEVAQILIAGKPGDRTYMHAAAALVEMPGDEVTEALIQVTKKASPQPRAALLKILTRRDLASQVDTLMAFAADPDEEVRLVAIDALKNLGDASRLPELIALLTRAESSRELAAAEKTLAMTCRRIGNFKAWSGPVQKAMPGASAEARVSLLRVVGMLGDDEAFELIADQVNAKDPDLRSTALRILSEWKSPAAMKPLWAVVQAPQSDREAILALRGYIELATNLKPESKAVSALARALEQARRPEEKRMVVGRLSGVNSLKAFDLAVACLEQADLKTEATTACRRMIPSLSNEHARERKALLKRFAEGEDKGLAGVAARKLLFIDSDTFVQVNFQPENCDIPEGYLADTGLSFGDRGNGFNYGWNVKNDETRDRDSGKELTHDTLNHIRTGRFWELALPNGAYWLKVVSGDASHTDQVNHLDIEGQVVKDTKPKSHFDIFEMNVNVEDGRLTIKAAKGASNPKICCLELRSLKTL